MGSHRTRTGEDPGSGLYRGIYLKRIPTYSFTLMISVMQEHGIAPEVLLTHTGLTVEELSREETCISFLQAVKFIRNVLRYSPLPEIGLVIGNQYHISTYGILGYAMMSCATWEDALTVGRRFHRVASSFVDIEVETQERAGRAIYRALPFYPDLTDIEPFTVEKLYASFVAVSRSVVGEPVYPSRVSFTWPRPGYAAAYESVFQCPIEFCAPQNQFVIPLEQLQRPLLAANEVCAAMGQRMCEERMSQYELADSSVRRRVADLLLANPAKFSGMESVACELHMSGRTLRRALRAEGITFQEICDELRHDLSRQYLRGSQLSLEEIASLVGFTESTNFRRAFKRWEGIPPARYRRQYRPSAY